MYGGGALGAVAGADGDGAPGVVGDGTGAGSGGALGCCDADGAAGVGDDAWLHASREPSATRSGTPAVTNHGRNNRGSVRDGVFVFIRALLTKSLGSAGKHEKPIDLPGADIDPFQTHVLIEKAA